MKSIIFWFLKHLLNLLKKFCFHDDEHVLILNFFRKYYLAQKKYFNNNNQGALSIGNFTNIRLKICRS